VNRKLGLAPTLKVPCGPKWFDFGLTLSNLLSHSYGLRLRRVPRVRAAQERLDAVGRDAGQELIKIVLIKIVKGKE